MPSSHFSCSLLLFFALVCIGSVSSIPFLILLSFSSSISHPICPLSVKLSPIHPLSVRTSLPRHSCSSHFVSPPLLPLFYPSLPLSPPSAYPHFPSTFGFVFLTSIDYYFIQKFQCRNFAKTFQVHMSSMKQTSKGNLSTFTCNSDCVIRAGCKKTANNSYRYFSMKGLFL